MTACKKKLTWFKWKYMYELVHFLQIDCFNIGWLMCKAKGTKNGNIKMVMVAITELSSCLVQDVKCDFPGTELMD